MRGPTRLNCEPCVTVEGAVVTLLYPYLVQFIALDSYESIKVIINQTKGFGPSVITTTLLNAFRFVKGNVRAINITVYCRPSYSYS